MGTLAELRRNPAVLREHLLGDEHAGPGLLLRVRDRVQEIAYNPGPGYRSGSVTGQIDQQHEDSGDEHKVFELYLGLRQWLGLGHDRPTEINRLRFSRKTDVQAVLGKGGLITQARRKVAQLLDHPTQASHFVDDCLILVDALNDWMENRCDHDGLAPLEGRGEILHLVCGDCGVRVNRDRRGNYLAV